jgi:type I restriction enzyme M protein
MAVVLPQGRFNNASDKDAARIPRRALPHPGRGGPARQRLQAAHRHQDQRAVRAEVERRPKAGPLCPKKDDYPIFFATMREPSKDNSGDKIYRAGPGRQARCSTATGT